MKKFLEDLKKELNKYSILDEEVQDILSDHEDMIREAINEGLRESDIPTKFGNPKVLAKELSLTATKKSKTVQDSSFTLINTFYTEDLESVILNTISDDLILERHDSYNVEVLMKNVKEVKDYEIELKGTVFTLKNKKGKKGFFSSNNSIGKVLVKLPLHLELKESNISVISGDCIIDDLGSEKIQLSSVSGDLNLDSLKCETIYIKTVSGDVDIRNISTGKALITAVSGDYKIANLAVVNDLDMNTVSGDFNVSNTYCDKLFLSTVSGDLKGIDFYPNEVSLKSVSGDIVISNGDKNKTINIVRKKSLSGEIKIK